jgi:disulfide bond formation protein DsbB
VRAVTSALETAFSVLAIILQVLIGLVAITWLTSLVFKPARKVLVEIRETLLGAETWMAWVVAAAATLGSLYFSESAHFQPCRLCWFQRIAMYPLAILLLVMAARRDVRSGFKYAIAFPVIGAAVSIYHEYIIYNPEAETAGCRQGVSCTVKWFEKFGYVQLPTLALTAFATIFVLLLFARWRVRAGEDLSKPPA